MSFFQRLDRPELNTDDYGSGLPIPRRRTQVCRCSRPRGVWSRCSFRCSRRVSVRLLDVPISIEMPCRGRSGQMCVIWLIFFRTATREGSLTYTLAMRKYLLTAMLLILVASLGVSAAEPSAASLDKRRK